MRKSIKAFLFILSLIAGLSIAYFQFLSDYEKHNRLKTKGITTKAKSRHYTSSGVDYAHIYFETNKGIEIEEIFKSGGEDGYYKNYNNPEIIYNPIDPHEFELLSDFNGYDLKWRIIFYFGIYGLALGFGILIFIRSIYKGYHLIKARLS